LKGLVEDRLGGDSEALPDALPEQPEAFFELGMSTMKSGLMKKARAIFKAFIAKFPSHDKADDAQFMIGETLFSEGRFTEAVTAFKTVYDQYQTGDRHKEAVLRIGLSYVRANNCKKALKIYEFAQKTFKGTPEAEAAAKEAKEIRAVCK
jgi:TolA-binding protein